MEEHEKTKETANIIDESELEAVAGGIYKKTKCFFVPEHPIQHNGGKDGAVWVKCKSGCMSALDYCSCHHENRCINRWHIMDHVGGEVWAARPLHEYNHMAGDKVVKDGSIPHP